MSFTRLFLENFRKFPQAEFAFAESGITLITGNNGSGKSTLLEAVHLLCMGRSFRDVRFSVLLRNAESETPAPYFRVRAEGNGGVPPPRAVSYMEGSTVAYKDGDRAVRRTELIGRPPMVLFSPDELQLITGSPDNRRKFMDRILCQMNPDYLARLRRYTRTLEERNALLKTAGMAPRADLDAEALLALDETLAADGNAIIAARQDLVREILAGLDAKLESIGAPSLAARIRMEPAETARGNLLGALIDSRSQDLAVGHTTVGPHRDDLRFLWGDLPAAAVLSQGEIRILTLALKLMEADRLARTPPAGRSDGVPRPLFLFDDLFSELDETRRLAVSTFLVSHPGQVFMTSCLPPPPDILSSLRMAITLD